MTELGVDTVTFIRGSYGPFSEEIQGVLTVAANANLIQEKQLGRMTALIPTDEYKRRQDEMKVRISPFKKEIDKTVDLFSRIRNTDQAEEVTTVIYSAKQLKATQDRDSVSEQDVFDFIMRWKKKFQKEDDQSSIASTIRNLQMLNWVKLQYSESLPYKSFQISSL